MEANRRFSMRITNEDHEIPAKRAEEAGLSRTDYMRPLLRTPVEVSSGKGIADSDAFALDRMAVANMAYQMRGGARPSLHPGRARAQPPAVLHGARLRISDDAENSLDKVSNQLEAVDAKADEIDAELRRMAGFSFGAITFEPKVKGNWS